MSLDVYAFLLTHKSSWIQNFTPVIHTCSIALTHCSLQSTPAIHTCNISLLPQCNRQFILQNKLSNTLATGNKTYIYNIYVDIDIHIPAHQIKGYKISFHILYTYKNYCTRTVQWPPVYGNMVRTGHVRGANRAYSFHLISRSCFFSSFCHTVWLHCLNCSLSPSKFTIHTYT